MKRILCVVTILALAFAFAGCGKGKDSQYVGKWQATGVVVGEEVAPWDSKEYGDVIMDIKDNGKMDMTTGGESDGTGTWEEKDGKLVITDKSDGKTQITGEMKDKKLNLEISGIVFVFEKGKK